jgi:hypothetical protein
MIAIIVDASGSIVGRAEMPDKVAPETVRPPLVNRVFIDAGETLSGERLYVENVTVLHDHVDERHKGIRVMGEKEAAHGSDQR